MVLRLVTVPPPAAGHDWSYVVPAQWLPYLYGVTAVLTTAVPLVTLPDESGNGNDATIQGTTSDFVLGQPGPFNDGADNVSLFHSIVTQSGNWYCQSAATAAFATANFTLESWQLVPAGTPQFAKGIYAQQTSAGASARLSVNLLNTGSDPYDIRYGWSTVGQFNVLGLASRAVWHHRATTYDGVSIREYVDGALVATNAAALPAVGATMSFACAGDKEVGVVPFGNHAGAAFYGTNLAVGNIANHAAAKGSWAAYKTAALVDTPVALYRVGRVAVGPNRIATLKVTDGTRTVAQFPASFAAASSSSFTWSWQVLGPGAQASTDGGLNAVPIPELQVDAGYVISVQTLDLAGTDQWSSIQIWFDDGTGPAGGGSGGLGDLQYVNALLVPEYRGSRT